MNQAQQTHPVSKSDEQLLQCCEIRPLSAGGAGGQHVNKNRTGVELIYQTVNREEQKEQSPDVVIRSQADERRERQRNLSTAVQRLRLQLAMHVRGGTELAWLAGRGRVVVYQYELRPPRIRALLPFYWMP